MKKKDFINQFKNSEIISDPELIYELLDEAENIIRAKFDQDPDNQSTVIQMADLLLNLELAQDDLEDNEISPNG